MTRRPRSRGSPPSGAGIGTRRAARAQGRHRRPGRAPPRRAARRGPRRRAHRGRVSCSTPSTTPSTTAARATAPVGGWPTSPTFPTCSTPPAATAGRSCWSPTTATCSTGAAPAAVAADGVESARWRTGEPRDGEIALTGPRVLLGGGRVVVPWREEIRYTRRRAGYHGGASLAEMAVPVLVLTPAPESLPRVVRASGRGRGARLVERPAGRQRRLPRCPDPPGDPAGPIRRSVPRGCSPLPSRWRHLSAVDSPRPAGRRVRGVQGPAGVRPPRSGQGRRSPPWSTRSRPRAASPPSRPRPRQAAPAVIRTASWHAAAAAQRRGLPGPDGHRRRPWSSTSTCCGCSSRCSTVSGTGQSRRGAGR